MFLQQNILLNYHLDTNYKKQKNSDCLQNHSNSTGDRWNILPRGSYVIRRLWPVEFGGPVYKELNFRNVTDVTDFPRVAP